MEMWVFLSALEVLCINFFSFEICCRRKYSGSITAAVLTVFSALVFLTLACFDFLKGDGKLLIIGFVFLLPYIFLYKESILRIFLVMCMCWTYTVCIYILAIQIGRLRTGESGVFIAFLLQTAMYIVTLYPFFKWCAPKYMFILRNMQQFDKSSSTYFNLNCFLHFIVITFLNFVFLEERGSILKISVALLFAGVTFLSYAMLYRMILDSVRIRELEQISEHDALTGLANRVRLFGDLQQLRQEKQVFSILFIDLDRFKEINDTYGHVTGDEYLRHFADICSSIFREYGRTYRYGGDEFVVICRGVIPEEAIEELKACRSWDKGAPCPYNYASTGSMVCRPPFPTADELLHEVDQRMYQMKAEKRKEACQGAIERG